jgi:hypothetical protein
MTAITESQRLLIKLTFHVLHAQFFVYQQLEKVRTFFR